MLAFDNVYISDFLHYNPLKVEIPKNEIWYIVYGFDDDKEESYLAIHTSKYKTWDKCTTLSEQYFQSDVYICTKKYDQNFCLEDDNKNIDFIIDDLLGRGIYLDNNMVAISTPNESTKGIINRYVNKNNETTCLEISFLKQK